MIPLLTVTIAREEDVVFARQRARRVAQLLGLDTQDQVRFATAVSELARNAYEYAQGGHADFTIDDACTPPQLVARVRDTGPGIRALDAVLEGAYVSPTGMGVGLTGARRLSDTFQIHSAPGAGTTVEIGKIIPRDPTPTLADVHRLIDTLALESRAPASSESQHQNHELLLTLGEVENRREETNRLNAELAETNRGVLALYSELEDRAEDVKRASELKTRFFSEVSHELRTPLASIISMTWFLLERVDGPLSDEQERQVTFIRGAAQTLHELVDDLLDLAKIEAGAFTARVSEFSIEELFAALRGMFRPILGTSPVVLTFDIEQGLPGMLSDEARVSQVLRNFITNAIKFTPEGAIRVSASMADATSVRFEVRDTGIGIAPEDQERVFQDFTQVDSHVQRRVRGTGLGLPLSKKLAVLLGGRIEFTSALGVGSAFSLVVPIVLPTGGTTI
jgi:signal transduction histidine kinase